MSRQIIMDSHGDTRHEFDPADAASVVGAEVRFRELTGKGFRAVALVKPVNRGGSSALSTRRPKKPCSFRSFKAAESFRRP